MSAIVTGCCTSLSSELEMKQHMNIALPWLLAETFSCFVKRDRGIQLGPAAFALTLNRKCLSNKYCLRKLTVEYMLLAFSFQILIYLESFWVLLLSENLLHLYALIISHQNLGFTRIM